MKKTIYDVIIVGGGQAGIPLAHSLAGAKKKVALVERRQLGGSCVNFGCIPTKAAIASARVAHLARRGGEFGLKIPKVEVDFAAVIRRAREISKDSRDGLEKGFAKTSNPKLFMAQARLAGRSEDGKNFRVQIDNGEILETREVILNTGTRALIPKIEGIETVKFVDSGNWLRMTELPKHIAILGGSYIGLEMAQFYRRMGSRVTVIETGERIAVREDADITDVLQKILEDEKIEFRLNAKVASVKQEDEKIVLHFDDANKPKTLTVSHLFVATGRKANTDDLGLETVGVERDERGIVKVKETLETDVKGIWAAGDIRGGYQFTHTAWDDYRIIESQMIGDKKRTTERIVPYAMFTDPELGRVGLTEKEAREKHRNILVNFFEMKANGKAREIGEPNGCIKIIIDKQTEKIIGAAVLSNEGAELVHEYVDLMNADAKYTVIRDSVHIHPTLAEAVQSATKID